jgi:N-methylhydantoinase B/oxoprolinase/acetone carboxylase alpha subunit
LLEAIVRRHGFAGYGASEFLARVTPSYSEAEAFVQIADLHADRETAYALLVQNLSGLRHGVGAARIASGLSDYVAAHGNLRFPDTEVLRVNLGIRVRRTSREPDSGGGVNAPEPPPSWDDVVALLEDQL